MNLIFIPGLLCTKEVWGTLNSLRSIYNCIDADVCSFNSIESLADNIIKYINKKEKYSIIGTSMGGYIALELAVREFNWLNKLVLLNTTANPVDHDTIPERRKAIQFAKNNDLESILNLSNGYCFFDKKQEYLDLERSMAHEIGCKAYINQQEAIINRRSYVDNLRNVTSNTLIVSSKHDQVIDYHDSLELFEKISNSELIMFDKVGHLPTIEKSKRTTDIVKSFLEL